MMPGRSFSPEKYRFGFNGQEKDDEIKGTGNNLNFKYRMYDPRIARFFAVDPLAAKYPYNSTYAFAENKLGLGRELEGLELVYDRSATYMTSIGDNTDMYVISRADYMKGKDKYSGYDVGLSKYVMDKGIRAYSSEKDAAKVWAPEGHSATRADPNNLERAAAIFIATAKGGPVENLYVLGNTVTGQPSDDPTVNGTVDPLKSSAIVGGKNLLDMKYRVTKTGVRKKYGDNFGVPGWVIVAEWFGYDNNESYEYTEEESYWKRSAFIHTHGRRDTRGIWSLTGGGMGRGYRGDIGFAMGKGGINVYLVLTNSETIYEILLIRAEDFKYVGYFKTETAGQKHASKVQKRIPLK